MNGLRDYKNDRQIGLEKTFAEYLAKLVTVFEEVRRVLKPTGVMFLNHGDSYVNDGGGGYQGKHGGRAGRRHTQSRLVSHVPDLGLKDKNLIGQPWRVAFALQEKGLILRQEIIWSKKSPMPESAKDRPTRSHETVFLFSKSSKYVYDEFAVLEPTTGNAHSRGAGANIKSRGQSSADGTRSNESFDAAVVDLVGVRNLRSVWTIGAQPFPDEWCTACRTLYSSSQKRSLERDDKKRLICKCGRKDAWVGHFAAFPKKLVERCIKAGASEHGCCAWCGSPYARVVRRPKGKDWHPNSSLKSDGVARVSKTRDTSFYAGSKRRLHKSEGLAQLNDIYRPNGNSPSGRHDIVLPVPVHVGWKKTCRCTLGGITPAVVLDCFSGAGTTAIVADELGRDAIGIELNPDYCDMSRARIERDRAARLAARPDPEVQIGVA